MPEKKTRNKRWARLIEKGYSIRHIAKLYKVHFSTVYKATRPYRKLSTSRLAKA